MNTLELDPKPWVYGDFRYTPEQRATFPSFRAEWSPRSLYSQNQADYS